jgi:hypothetical protein
MAEASIKPEDTCDEENLSFHAFCDFGRTVPRPEIPRP